LPLQTAPGELYRLIVSENFAALRQDPETAELEARRRFGHGSMDRECKADLFRRIQIFSRGMPGSAPTYKG
jgi:hypothetical protein